VFAIREDFALMMEIADSHSPGRQWTIRPHRRQLLATLRAAAARSAHLGRAILASFTRPIPWCDPLLILIASKRAGLEPDFFWEQPARHSSLVGIGTATTIVTAGATRFATAAATWSSLLRDAIVRQQPERAPAAHSAPLLFGGFAFDPSGPHSPLWKNFPDGLLILPHLLWRSSPAGATLTINHLTQPDDPVEQITDTICARIATLSAAVQELARMPWQTEKVAGPFTIQEQPAMPAWTEQVAATIAMIRQGAYQKVVLARSLQVTAATPTTFDTGIILYRLRHNYPTAAIFALQRGHACFVGATPERLVRVQHGRVYTMALAGSAPRGATPAADQRLGLELLRSAKNQKEHAIVVTMLREALATLCTSVSVATTPRLLLLKNIQHLATPITGVLLPGYNLLEIVARLHPTPAVSGLPLQAALAAIRANEPLDRGWYAGPIGWIDASGNGEFVVALRSALIADTEATLFTGCGLVADSDPQSEYTESCLKLQAMLSGLGLASTAWDQEMETDR
jgi:isochorismate synthase